jgi:glucokinase
LTVAATSEPVLAIDVGGTRMKGAVVDVAGRELHACSRPTPHADGPAGVVDAVVAFAADLTAHAGGVAAAGIVVPGIVDEDRGTAVLSANLGWRDLPMRRLLEARLGVPLAFGQDVRAGGLAEVRMGAARGARDALFVPIGTGIGAAVVLDGRPVTGSGFAGEIGHLVVDAGGAPCGCGLHGCLETVASAPAVARRYAARTGRATSVPEIAAAAGRGDDPAAVAVWAEAVDALATVLATCATLLGPEIVVVGGGLAESGALLLDPLRAALDERLSFQRRPRVVRAALGDRAGALGAGLMARDRLRAGMGEPVR